MPTPSRDYIGYFGKRQVPRVEPPSQALTPILFLEWCPAHEEEDPSTAVETIPKLKDHIGCDPISLHKRNEITLEALGKTFGDLTIEEI